MWASLSCDSERGRRMEGKGSYWTEWGKGKNNHVKHHVRQCSFVCLFLFFVCSCSPTSTMPHMPLPTRRSKEKKKPMWIKVKRVSIHTSTAEQRRIKDTLTCKSKTLIYLIHCKNCSKQCIVETKRQLNELFGEHRCSILLVIHNQLTNPTPVPENLNQLPGHSNSINDILLIPLELIHSNRKKGPRRVRYFCSEHFGAIWRDEPH